MIRIPDQLDVPVTPRVQAILDTAAMQRLKRVAQLGLVAQVYPGARHSRFEHSLGVYRLGRQVLVELFHHASERMEALGEGAIKKFLLAALLHDVGHWPYCHPIEDMRLEWVPRHEDIARRLICEGEVARVIDEQWNVAPHEVADFLSKPSASVAISDAAGAELRLLQSILSGPIDIDKMDYLQRDSLHAGVPYGRNFDVGRLIGSLRIACQGDSLAIDEKGKTAAEMMVFARYVMFSEVYWHHAVRSATAMLQRLVYQWGAPGAAEQWLHLSDAEFEYELMQACSANGEQARLAGGLFGRHRRLYKRFGEYTVSETPEIHAVLARRPYADIVECSRRLGDRLSRWLTHPLREGDILIDAPPVKLEVQFALPVLRKLSSGVGQVSLSEISPVVKALATDQFDNHVKKVRVFVAPERHADVSHLQSGLAELLVECAGS